MLESEVASGRKPKTRKISKWSEGDSDTGFIWEHGVYIFVFWIEKFWSTGTTCKWRIHPCLGGWLTLKSGNSKIGTEISAQH